MILLVCQAHTDPQTCLPTAAQFSLLEERWLGRCAWLPGVAAPSPQHVRTLCLLPEGALELAKSLFLAARPTPPTSARTAAPSTTTSAPGALGAASDTLRAACLGACSSMLDSAVRCWKHSLVTN